MSNATDKQLGELHGKLAQSMLRALNAADDAQILLDNHSDELPDAVVDFLEKQAGASPALLTAISKFLKDNDITCATEDSETMTDLEKRLQNKSRKRVGNVVTLDAND